jgi:hypothetical protein
VKKILILSFCLFQSFVNSQVSKEDINFKGYVLNTEDNTPVIYATIILQKEEIYLVTDKNGFFEFSINENSIPNATLEVSSIGFETKKISLSKFQNNIFLKPKVEELSEVLITVKKRISALEVIKETIKRKKDNYPIKPYNQRRYTHVKINEQDKMISDFEFINKEYHRGYNQLGVATRKVEQTKWNVSNNQNNIFKNSDQIYRGSKDPVQHAGYLNKGKYKKYIYKFVDTDNTIKEDFFVIDFKSNKTKLEFTQRNYNIYFGNIYNRAFTGRLYIRKKDFVVVKVIEDWVVESENKSRSVSSLLWLNKKQEYVNSIILPKHKHREIFEYKTKSDNKSYPSKFLEIHFIEGLDIRNRPFRALYNIESFFFDLNKNNVESIPWEGYGSNRSRKYSLFENVASNSDYWKKFYEEHFNRKE